MLRVFLGAFGEPGHAFPMLALGARLAERGHQVSYETWARWREPVEAAGLEFLPAPEYPVFPTREQPLGPYEAVLRATPVTRSAIAERRPDIVVHDILTLAPALAAELEGVPAATLVPHLYPVAERGFPPYATGARMPRTALARAIWSALEQPLEGGLHRGRRELNDVRDALGLAPVARLHGGISEQLCLVATFPQLEYPRRWPGHVHVVGPLLWEPPQLQTPLPAGAEPLVVVAPSTSQDPEQRLLRTTLTGLTGRVAPAVRVLAATGRHPPTPADGTPPRNSATPIGGERPQAMLVDWLRYSHAMAHASLVVCHAGHGTLAHALAAGAPVLAVAHRGDMAENAARVDWAGAGVRLPWRFLTPATVRLAVSRALGASAGYAARAAELGAWARGNDGATRAAELVESLASSQGHEARTAMRW